MAYKAITEENNRLSYDVPIKHFQQNAGYSQHQVHYQPMTLNAGGQQYYLVPMTSVPQVQQAPVAVQLGM